MTKHSTIMRTDPLEQAIQTVIQDARTPKNLRTALKVYGRQWAEEQFEVGTMRPEHTELSSEADPYLCDSPSFADEDSFLLSCEKIVIKQGLRIIAIYDKQSLEWSVDINGQRYERLPFKVMEDFIECALVATEVSLRRKSCRRLQ
jgi:hypothetical protein